MDDYFEYFTPGTLTLRFRCRGCLSLCPQRSTILLIVAYILYKAPHSYPTQYHYNMGSVVLPHLITGWHVDQAIMSEEERLVVIRFGRDWDADCMKQDEVLYRIADRVKNFAVIYVCDLDQVPDFKQMYELYDPMTLMFFFRNKHMVRQIPTQTTRLILNAD